VIPRPGVDDEPVAEIVRQYSTSRCLSYPNDHPLGGLRVSAAARKTAMYHPLDSKRCSVQSHLPPSSSSLRIDEDWLQQWIAFGMLDMAIYLTKQARFAAYLARRDQPLKRPARARKR
jgi:hypothetical protein